MVTKISTAILWRVSSFINSFLSHFNLGIFRLNASYANPTNTMQKNLLASCSGVLHIGAHFGQEAKLYSDNALKVMWIEGDPQTYRVLQENLAAHPGQSARLILLGEIDKEVDFYITNNDGQSSSVYVLNSNIPYRNLEIVASTKLSQKRLDSFLFLMTSNTLITGLSTFKGPNCEFLKGQETY